MSGVLTWLVSHKLWVIVSIIVLIGIAGTGMVLGERRDNRQQLERQRIEDEARRQESALMALEDSQMTPSPVAVAVSPSPTQQAKKTSSPTPSVQPTTQQASPSPSTAVASPSPSPSPTQSNTAVFWSNNGTTWQASGTPPACASPTTFTTPVELSLVTSVLYPGQTRGGDYKPHGGFRFDNTANDGVTVKAPMNATLYQGSRYIENGGVQYIFDFLNSCGVMYRFDHLRTLSSKLAEAANTLPEAKADDTRTTPFPTTITVTAGETLATAVGHPSNTFVDWGVYDLRQKNEASQSSGYASTHQSKASQAFYGVCWFDWLNTNDKNTAKGLPATASNATSDYCK